jgi:hypothetical protein
MFGARRTYAILYYAVKDNLFVTFVGTGIEYWQVRWHSSTETTKCWLETDAASQGSEDHKINQI